MNTATINELEVVSSGKSELPMNQRFEECHEVFVRLAKGLTRIHQTLVVSINPENDVKAEIKIQPDKSEAGKLIGAKGKTINCLQSVARAASLQYGIRLFINLDTDDCRPNAKTGDAPFYDPSWTPDELIKLIKLTSEACFAYPVEVKSECVRGKFYNLYVFINKEEPERVLLSQPKELSLVDSLKHLFNCIACASGGSADVAFYRSK